MRRIIIIGAGPAGLACAAFLDSAEVLLLEGERVPGKRILVTGGGRCNCTHEAAPEDLCAAFRGARNFVRTAFQQFPPERQLSWFEAIGVPCYTDGNGCAYPESNRAEDIRSALVQTVLDNGAEIRCGTRVKRILAEPSDDGGGRVTGVELGSSEKITADVVVIATGGAARPALGSDGATWRLAEALGLETQPARPALGALHVKNPGPLFRALAGVTLPQAELRIIAGNGKEKKPFSSVGNLLCTGTGFSGPAALNLCAEASAQFAADGECRISVCWDAQKRSPEGWIAFLEVLRKTHGTTHLQNCFSGIFPKSLATFFCSRAGIAPEMVPAQLPKAQLLVLANLLCRSEFILERTATLDECMVSAGGIAQRGLDKGTLRSKRYPNLYCIGEAVDVSGFCGGYNLAWAWASAFLAARSAGG